MIYHIKQFILDWWRGYPVLGSAARSPKWSEVRNAFLKSHPTCAVCGTKNSVLKALNIHHVVPFHEDKTLELNPQNLITLCRPHHLLFGHFMNWKSWNVDVRTDSDLWYNRIQKRPMSDSKVAD